MGLNLKRKNYGEYQGEHLCLSKRSVRVWNCLLQEEEEAMSLEGV